ARAEAPAVAAPGDVSAQLANLAGLHAQGALTDEEFAAAKARVLAGE
ncbi:MAG TPA: SHOCT domain-containing protein, partial [Dehalococcoidia bacterium]|nr:SHOCT domain-containing protein [Dehalococcoidia bacterium]